MFQFKKIPYMLKFSRDYYSCYIAHLDWIRFIQVALDQSNLPLIYTEGYSPKAKLKFSPPLPVGLQSDTELVLIYLRENVTESVVGKAVEDKMPEGMDLLEVKLLHPAPPKNPFHTINGAKYEMHFPGEIDSDKRKAIIDIFEGNNLPDDVPDDIKGQFEWILKILNADEFLIGTGHIEYVARLESHRTFHPVRFSLALHKHLDLPHIPHGRRLSFLHIEETGARELFIF
jgi:hypothetical protein